MSNDKNVAIIDIDEYNDLRDFKETVEKGDHICLKHTLNSYSIKIYGNTQKISDEIIKRNEYLLESVESQGKKINELHNELGGYTKSYDILYKEKEELIQTNKNNRLLSIVLLVVIISLLIALVCL